MTQPESNKYKKFVDNVLQKCNEDKGLRSHLKRGMNPALESESWEFLIRNRIDIENEDKRKPYALIAGLIATSKAEVNGTLSFGKALLMAYDNDNENGSAKAKLRRLFACATTSEACVILRPLLNLIISRVSQPLDFAQLLKQLNDFSFNPEKVRVKWAKDFFTLTTEEAVQ